MYRPTFHYTEEGEEEQEIDFVDLTRDYSKGPDRRLRNGKHVPYKGNSKPPRGGGGGGGGRPQDSAHSAVIVISDDEDIILISDEEDRRGEEEEREYYQVSSSSDEEIEPALETHPKIGGNTEGAKFALREPQDWLARWSPAFDPHRKYWKSSSSDEEEEIELAVETHPKIGGNTEGAKFASHEPQDWLARWSPAFDSHRKYWKNF